MSAEANTSSVSNDKLRRLEEALADLDSVVLAYSGGLDSTFLLKVCRDTLHDRVLAVTAVSETYPPQEADQAEGLASSIGAKHRSIRTSEMEDSRFIANSPDRCYFCKQSLFSDLKHIAAEEGYRHVIDGTNQDDLRDYRPGMQAAAEAGIRHPLLEAGLTRAEIAASSREMGLPTADKPAQACLASRIPYGTPITAEVLAAVNEAEIFLRQMVSGQLRVRHHGRTARIEVGPEEMIVLVQEPNRSNVVRRLGELGYIYVTLDLAGYRMGSLNVEDPSVRAGGSLSKSTSGGPGRQALHHET